MFENNINNIIMSRCIFLIGTSLLSFIVYLGIMVHLKSLNSVDWQWRINSMEGDLKLLMQSLNSCGHKSKVTDITKCTKHSNCDTNISPMQEDAAVEDVIKKHTTNLKTDIQEIRKVVDQLLCKNVGTGLSSTCKPQPINLATEALGTKIVSVDDEPLCSIYPILAYLGIQTLKNAPREMLNNQMQPGKCYAFKGCRSTVVIKLQKPVYVSSVSIEHILENMMPYGNNTNAPKRFAVHGIADPKEGSCKENCEHCYGEFEYKNELKQPLQIFQVLNKDPPCAYRSIKFVFLSNHGHPKHTCVYRIGVYGKVEQ